jgi:hypothetical protein
MLKTIKVSQELKDFFEQNELQPRAFYANMGFKLWRESNNIEPYDSNTTDIKKLNIMSYYIMAIHEDVKSGWLKLESKQEDEYILLVHTNENAGEDCMLWRYHFLTIDDVMNEEDDISAIPKYKRSQIPENLMKYATKVYDNKIVVEF